MCDSVDGRTPLPRSEVAGGACQDASHTDQRAESSLAGLPACYAASCTHPQQLRCGPSLLLSGPYWLATDQVPLHPRFQRQVRRCVAESWTPRWLPVSFSCKMVDRLSPTQRSRPADLKISEFTNPGLLNPYPEPNSKSQIKPHQTVTHAEACLQDAVEGRRRRQDGRVLQVDRQPEAGHNPLVLQLWRHRCVYAR